MVVGQLRSMSGDVPGWDAWADRRGLICAKLKGVDRSSLSVYFQALHGATEAVFRRALLVGLRLNAVSYKSAQDWLHDHDVTPGLTDYPKRFDRLYAIKGVSWNDITRPRERFRGALDLWNGYSKVIRNHLAHSIRSYNDEWLLCAIQVDQILLMEFDLALEPIIGGSVAHALTELVPRLPVGRSKQDLSSLTGIRLSKPRPRASLVGAQAAVKLLLDMPNT
jgi:hypothetical protein